MINEDRKKLYDALSSEYDLGTYEEFERNIGDSVKRKKLYDAASADYDLGDFESYSQRIGPTHKESLDAFTAEHGSWLNDFEARDSAETNMSKAGMSSGVYVPAEGSITGEERKRYMELHKQEEALKKAWFTSDEYLAQKDADALFLSNVQKDLSRQRVEYAQANPPIKQEGLFQINPYAVRGAEADTELERFATASRLMDDAIKMHNAPSRYDDKNVFLKFGKGAGDVLSDADFWTAGLTEIADNLGVRDVLSTVQEKLGNLNDLSEEAIENILSPAEKAVLQAWAINTQEQLKRKDDLSRAYQAGQGATESLGFMAEFALTGGIGKAATEGVEQMVKWLGKKALTKVGGMTDDVAAKVLKETGEKIAQSTVGKYGVGLAESLAEAAGRTGVMPSTFRNISEKATEIETDENGNNYLVKMNDAFAKGYVDSLIENLSEGGRVNALGTLFGDVAGKIPAYKKMVDKFSHTKASELWDAFNSSGVMNTLRAGGWHGLGEEYLEEWYGNALRTLTGVDKEALKDFATVDNQIVTLTSFLPMTIFGGTVSTAQVLSANKDLEKKAAALKSALMERGYDEAQANNMIDMMRGATPAEVSETLTPIVNSVANRNTNEAAALMKPVGEFAAAVQRWQSFNTKYNYQEQEQRDGLRAQMEENLGQFWQQDENGRQTVQRGVNEKGEVVYMLGKPSAEDVEAGVTSEVAAVTSDGRKVFVNPSEYQLEDELEMNTFLGNEIMAEKGNQEQARMIEEKEAKIAAIRETAVPGTAVNIGTAEAPMQAIVLQRNPDGVIVNTPDGQTRQMTYEEFGNYVGVNAVPMTDAQIDEHEADVLTADRAQREAALDQEYENEDAALEELSEAEDEIEQAVDSNIPLPLKADGSVDQTALWNKDPERWAQWNDEQRQDGGANSIAYINSAIAREQTKLAEIVAAYDAEPDFDTRSAMESEIAIAQDRLNRLSALQQNYVPLVAQQEQEGISTEKVERFEAEPKARERSVESEVARLYGLGLSDEEVMANLDAKVAKAQKALDTQSKKAPKMGADEKAYITKKREYQQKMQELQQELDFAAAARQAVMDVLAQQTQIPDIPGVVAMEKDTEPQNAVEFAARELGLKDGGIKLQRQSFAEHTGYGPSEMKKFFGLFKSKQDGGLTIEEAGERLMELDRENNTGFFDQKDPNAGLNAILDAIGAVNTIGELRSYVARQRQAEAQREADAAYSAMMAEYEATYGETMEESAHYDEEMRSEILINGLSENEQQELNNIIFAEEISQNGTEGYQTEASGVYGSETGSNATDVEPGTEGVYTGGNGILQEIQSDNSGRDAESQESQRRPEGEGSEQDALPSVPSGESTTAVESSLDEDMPDFTSSASAYFPNEEMRQKFSAMRARINEWAQKLGVQVRIMETLDDVGNQSARQQVLAGRKVYGYFDPATGEVAFYLPDFLSLDGHELTEEELLSEIDKTYIHEVVSHRGLRGLLGEEKYGELCDMVWDAMTEQQKANFLNYPGVNGNSRIAADEFIAHFAENVDYNDNRTLWDKIVDFIKDFFNSVELPAGISNESLAELLRHSYRNLAKSAAAIDTNANKQAEGNTVLRAANGSLVGLHNISEEKLRKVLKQGGLANPSTAVVNISEYLLDEYGEISLIMPSSLVDASTGDNIGTYTGDAWTPTYPPISRKVDDRGWEIIKDRIRAAIGEESELYSDILHGVDNYLDDNRSSKMEFVFLKEKGIEPEIAYKGADGFVGMRNLEAILGVQGLRDGLESYERYKDASPMAKRSFNMWLDADGNKQSHRELKEQLKKEPKLADVLKLNEDVSFVDFDSFTYNIFRKEQDAGKIDTYDTMGAAARYVDANNLRGEFEAWLESLMQQAGAKEVFFAGYTRSGDRIYKDNTLENVSRHMRLQGRTNAYDDHGLSATKSALLQRLTSLSQIRKNRARLQNEATYNKEYDALKDRLWSIISQLADMQEISSNQFMNVDYAESRLQEAITKRNPIAHLNQELGYDIDPTGEYADEIKSFIKDVQKMPVKYFETKFERPVYLNEFAAAVMPTTTSEDIKQAVSEAGMPIFEYDSSVEGSRKEATLKATEGEGIRFRAIGEKGAANLDKAEEATIRLDNLAVARQMEKSGKDAKAIKLATGWERGVDKLWRYEVPDDFDLSELENRLQESLNDGLSKAWGIVYPSDLGELTKAYPDFNVDIMVWVGEEFENTGEYSPATEGDETTFGKSASIEVKAKTVADIKDVLVHEIQHAIQEKEGFAEGGSVFGLKDKLSAELDKRVARIKELREEGRDAEADELMSMSKGLAEAVINNDADTYQNYRKLAGEVEARNVSARLGMSEQERRESLLSETEDVAREDQIVLMDRLGVSEMGTNMFKTHITPEQDAAYMKAVEAGDMEAAQRMVTEAARLAGYASNSDYQGSLAFNGVAPSGYAYYDTKEERIEAWENGNMEDDQTLGDYKDAGIDISNLGWSLTSPVAQRMGNEYTRESIKNLSDAVNGDSRTIKVYRAVDADIKEDSIRNGDWVTPSRAYAEYHIGLQDWKEGRIIEQEVDIDDIWWDGNDINEWGYNDGKGYAYKNTPNNRKLLAPVTYDNNGNVIPLSERFNPENDDIRFRTSNNNQAIFVSNAARAVEGIKQEKATPEQWLKMIEKNGGLKAGEDKWMGLSDWLKESDKKTLSKQEVLDFVNEHMIVIEEQHYSEDENALDGKRQEIQEALQGIFDEYVAESEDMNDDMFMKTHYDYAIQKLADELGYTAFNAPYINNNAIVELDFYEDDLDTLHELSNKLGLEKYDGTRNINDTRLSYTTEGLKDRHEIALTLPTIEPWNERDEIHFGDAGDGRAVAWIRFGETKKLLGTTEVDGKKKFNWAKVLVIDEIQSKRHQEGRERGYISKEKERELKEKFEKAKERFFALDESLREKYGSDFVNAESNDEYMEILSPEDYKEYMNAQMDFSDARLEMNNPRYDAVPDAPFDKNWHELAMKRMLRYAAENGYDVIAWTKGDQQAERYNIGDVVANVDYRLNDDGSYHVDTMSKLGYQIGSIPTTFNSEQELADVFGKEIARKIASNLEENKKIIAEAIQEKKDIRDWRRSQGIDQDSPEYEGVLEKYAAADEKLSRARKGYTLSESDFRIGGEGMKGFYDKMLPAFMNKYGKKWGVKVEDIYLNLEGGLTMHSVPVTEEMKESVMEGQVMFRSIPITQEVQDEMDAISATAIVRGNYLKAPNGAETNLTPEQWAMVRTKNFKRWFGDWELPHKMIDVVRGSMAHSFANFDDARQWAKDNIVRVYSNEETNGKGEIEISNNAVKKYLSGSAVKKSDSKDLHLAVLKILPSVIRNGVIAETHADYMKDENGERTAESRINPDITIHRVYGAVRIGDDIYRVKVTLKEHRDENRPNSPHSYEATKIELLAGTLVSANGSNPNTNNSISTANLLKGVEKSYESGKYLLDDYSKVVDENGEPMVVYHGSPNEFSTFDEDMIGENTDSGFYGRGFYFATTEEEARGYGKHVIPAFLNMHNPLDLNELYAISDKWDGATADGAVRWWYGLASMFPNDAISETTYASIDGDDWTIMDLKNRIDELAETSDTPFADATEEFGIDEGFFDMIGEEDVNLPDELTDALDANGYDGVINAGVENNELVALRPNQIKSATDNTGEFSAEDNDIRFRTRYDVNTNPTEAQKKAGNYKMGHIRLDGYNITIENPKGSVRRGTDSKGNAWENTLNNDYGYIRGTEGVDGDHIDVYLSDNPTEGNVFVIDQVNPETREFDEHKVMYGFNSAEEAREAYLANFSEGWNGLGTITEVSKDEFKKWIESSHRKTKPFIEYKSVKIIGAQSEGEEMKDDFLPSTGTPTDELVTNGLQLTPAQTAEVAANIFAALPEESRKKITDGLNGNILGLKDAILQIPTSLASKENWNEEDKQMADVVAEEMTKMAGEMTRPFSASEGLWLLYNNLNRATDLVSQASRAFVQRNLGFDAETLARQEQAKEDVRFRTVGDATSNAQASLYNRGAVNVWTRLKESYVDMMASVEELVKAIEKRSGKVAQGFENILLALNQQSSKGLAAMELYTQKFLNPMFDEIRRIMDETKMKYEDIVRYVILKHGLERNKKLAQRDARAHYQEIYDDIISKITGMTAAQKRTYLTNAQLKEGDAKAELATLQAVDMSAMTDEEKREHKKKLAAARKAVEEAEEHLRRAQKIASLSEQEAQDELDMIFEEIENGTDSVFKEMRENDYSGISSMFYDQLGVDRKNFSTEEQYQAALMDAKKDKYSSLADVEAAAEAEVASFERKTDTKELWKRINAATKETLRQQYEANMISKDQYLNLRDMFEYYVPLRGFKDNTAEDMYTYYRKPNSTGYTKPILGAEGRKTEAESPFGWISAMAGSAIASNVKNEAKLALYYFVSNRPENGIATISKTWFVDSGEVDERGKKIFKPAYPPFSEDLSSAEGKAQYEIWQANMKELQKKGQAYEAGQRLNLGNAVVNISDANKPEHIVNVKVGGKDYTVIINGNPRAAQAINGDLNIEGTAQDYSALFGPVLRWMSSVNTSYNPEFWITNMMRDMAFTMMAVNIKEDPAYRRKFKKNYLKAFKVVSLVAKNEKGTIGDSYLEEQYKDFVKYGGVTGYTQIKDSETWEQEIENYLSSNDPESIKSGKVMRGMKTAFHAAHRFGESLEQVSRFAAFLTARETGKSINEAINDAKEITVNFNRKGSGKMITLEEAKNLTGKNGQPLTKRQQWMVVGLSSIAPLGRRFIMFFNAAIQGLNARDKLMKKNPKRFTGWALGYAAVGMMNAVLHAMLDDDDDYLDIPQYERRNSLMIGGNGAYFKWALPQEARAFYALGDLAVETVMGRNPHQNFLGEALKIGTEILPVNPSEGWKAFMPSVAIPFIELALNEDYKGAPIYNEQKWLSEEEKERTAKWSNAYQGTGWTYVKIAQGLNFITGGNKHDAGWINLQPEKLEHLVQSAFGGTIRTADKFINTISAALDPEEPVTIRQTPFLNRFLTINDERFKNVHVNDVFDYYKADAEHALTLEKQYIKDRDMDSLTELRSSDEYQWAKIYGKYKKPLKAIQDKIKVADGTAEKKELMKQQDELKKRMIKEISEL